MSKVLIIEDEELLRKSLKRFLEKCGHQVVAVARGEEGLKVFETTPFDLCLLDLKLPKLSGIQVLERMREISEYTQVVIITAYGTTETAVKAMKLGAADYLQKPLNLDELRLTIERLLSITRLKDELAYRREAEVSESQFANIIGRSPEMKKVFEQMRKVIHTEKAITVLIQGETGTGKELVAKAIHYQGLRKEKPFVEINCTAIPDTLIEAELFGYERGAFTNAKRRKRGLVELAEGGSLFLDEVGGLNLSLQLKLLKVVEEKSFRRLGGTEDLKVDVRVIAATNRDLEKAVKDGSFREDLYYRLDVITIKLPPLRERGDDSFLLAEHFLKGFSKEYGRGITNFSKEARELIRGYSWPGNVRELKNVLERAVLMGSEEIIRPQDLAISLDQKAISISEIEFPSQGISLKEVEKELIQKAMEMAKGNRSKAARLLGLSRDTLRYRLRKYGI